MATQMSDLQEQLHDAIEIFPREFHILLLPRRVSWHKAKIARKGGAVSNPGHRPSVPLGLHDVTGRRELYATILGKALVLMVLIAFAAGTLIVALTVYRLKPWEEFAGSPARFLQSPADHGRSRSGASVVGFES